MPNETGFFWDLDETLLNTGEFKKRRILAAKALGISEDDYSKTYEEAKRISGVYDINEHIRLLTGEDRVGAELLRIGWRQALKNSRDLVYKDAEVFMSFLLTQPVDMILVSRGEISLQYAKLIYSGLDQYFSAQIFVGNESKGKPISRLIEEFKYKTAFFIDDTLEEILDVQKSLREMTELKCKTHLIWLNRKAKEQPSPPLIELGREDPLLMFVGEIIPVPDLYTLQKMYQQMVKGENS